MAAVRHSGAVHDDDARRRPRWALVRRLGSPAGLVLAGLCLLLPFFTASCTAEEQPRAQWRVTYTGVDVLTGGRPAVALTMDADQQPIRPLDDAELRDLLDAPPAPLGPQPVAWVAAALMVAALAGAALPSPIWRATATAGLAIAAAVVLGGAVVLARQDATDAVATVLSQATSSRDQVPMSGAELRAWDSYPQIRDLFHYLYGFWIALAALFLVGVANVVGVVRLTRRP